MQDLKQQVTKGQTMTTGNKKAINEIAETTGINKQIVEKVILNFFSFNTLGYFLKRQIEVTINSLGRFKTNAKGKFLLKMKENVQKRNKRERESKYNVK